MAKWTNANCYGYAAKVNDWLLVPGGYADVKDLLLDNPQWKPVRKQDMVLGKKYIAYRFSADDFHFMTRDEKGHWRHKPGAWPVKAISTKDVFASAWYNGYFTYTSKVHLFEVLE